MSTVHGMNKTYVPSLKSQNKFFQLLVHVLSIYQQRLRTLLTWPRNQHGLNLNSQIWKSKVHHSKVLAKKIHRCKAPKQYIIEVLGKHKYSPVFDETYVCKINWWINTNNHNSIVSIWFRILLNVPVNSGARKTPQDGCRIHSIYILGRLRYKIIWRRI